MAAQHALVPLHVRQPLPLSRHRRAGRLVALLCAAVLALPAQGQLPFAVPPPAGVVVVPLLLMLAPMAHEFSRSDRERARELERAHDWAGLEALATRRLHDHPGDPRWLGLRGRARLFMGRWDAAAQDLRTAFDSGSARPLAERVDVGLAWALAESLRPGGGDVAPMLAELARLAPERPEPAALAAALGTAAAVGLRGDGLQLALGRHRVDLAEPGWQAVPVPAPPPLRAGGNPQFIGGQDVRLQAVAAVGPAAPGGPPAGVFWGAANTARAWGATAWSVDDPCRRPPSPAVLVESAALSHQRPDCLVVREAAAGELPDPLRALVGADVPADAPGWWFAYERYGMDWAVQARLWLPQRRIPGPLAAAVWGRAWAAGLRPLADTGEGRTAGLPPLRP